MADTGIITDTLVFNRALSHKELIVLELIQAAEPFTSGDTVDETSGTVPLMDRLEKALKKAKEIL